MNPICIIPARCNSVRIPNKNLREFHGRPIISYPIDAAKSAGFRIIVSTDGRDIKEHAHSHGVQVHLRPWDDPHGEMGTQEVVSRVVDLIQPPSDTIVMCLYATTPLIDFTTLRDVVKDHRKNMEAGWDGWTVSSYADRVEDCGGFYIGSAFLWHTRRKLVRTTTNLWPLHNHIDINTEEDWSRAEKVYANLRGEDE